MFRTITASLQSLEVYAMCDYTSSMHPCLHLSIHPVSPFIDLSGLPHLTTHLPTSLSVCICTSLEGPIADVCELRAQISQGGHFKSLHLLSDVCRP